ncbi:MAG: hypothetical protein WA624_24185 [Methylocella sp.]
MNVLLCFLSPSSFAAKIPSPVQPAAARNSAQPGPPEQSGEKAPDQPNAKGGEAAAIASIAKLAVDMNNETVKRIETFYSNTVHNFVYHITIVATLVGLVGIASVVLMAERTAKRQSKKALGPVNSGNENTGNFMHRYKKSVRGMKCCVTSLWLSRKTLPRT